MVMVTDPISGCSTNDTAFVTLFTPPVVSLSVPATICIDDASATISVAPAGGTLVGPGLNGFVFTPDSTLVGTQYFTYTYIDINGCSETITDSILVDLCTGTTQNEIVQVEAYPNPANESFVLKVAQEGHLEVINELGQIIDRITITNELNVVTTQNYSPGLYLIRFTGTTGNTTQIRLIVQH